MVQFGKSFLVLIVTLFIVHGKLCAVYENSFMLYKNPGSLKILWSQSDIRENSQQCPHKHFVTTYSRVNIDDGQIKLFKTYTINRVVLEIGCVNTPLYSPILKF